MVDRRCPLFFGEFLSELVYLRSTSTIPPTFFWSVSFESARIMTERHLGPSFRGALIEFIFTVGPVTRLLKVQLLHSRPERASELLGHVDHPLNATSSTSGATATGSGRSRTGCGQRRNSGVRESPGDRRPLRFRPRFGQDSGRSARDDVGGLGRDGCGLGDGAGEHRRRTGGPPCAGDSPSLVGDVGVNWSPVFGLTGEAVTRRCAGM